jgi:hypothetical protein
VRPSRPIEGMLTPIWLGYRAGCLAADRQRSILGRFRRAGPTLALAADTGALSVGVEFLPVVGAERGLGPLVTGAIAPAWRPASC